MNMESFVCEECGMEIYRERGVVVEKSKKRICMDCLKMMVWGK